MVGIYSNYYMIINQVLTFLLLIFNSITASVGNLAAEETNKRQETVFKNMTFLSFLIYYVCSVLLFCCINPFITIWVGKEFLLDISIVTVLVLIFYTTGMLIPVSTFRTANGLFVQGKYRPLIMAILNIVISIVLVKQIGLIGVFLGTLLSRVFTLMWYDPLLVYKKAFNKSPKKYFIKYFIYTFILVITCFVVYLIGEIIPVNNMIIKLGINVILSLIFTFVTIIVIFRKTEEYKYVKNIIDNFISKLKIKRGKMANEN